MKEKHGKSWFKIGNYLAFVHDHDFDLRLSSFRLKHFGAAKAS